MQRRILKQNRAQFLQVLGGELDGRQRLTFESLLRHVERDLAFLEASIVGAVDDDARSFVTDPRVIQHFRAQTLGSPKLGMAIDPGPGLHIVDVNETFERESLQSRASVVGRPLFDTFPDNPDNPLADGVSALYASLRTAAISGKAQVMPAQRYDVQTAEGVFVKRLWRVVNTPVFDDSDRLLYLLQEAERLDEGG